MAHVVITDADATVKWYNAVKGFGFFVDPIYGDIFFHRTMLGTFQPWEMQEGAPAVISFATGKDGRLQVTQIHKVSLGHVKSQGDTFCLPEPSAEISVEAPVLVEEVVLKKGGNYRGVVGKVMPGFGFLKVEGMGKFLFFHNSALSDPDIKPKIGDRFDFVLGENDKGLAAIEMKLVVPEVPADAAEPTALVESTSVADVAPAPVEVPKLERKRTRVGKGRPPQEDGIPVALAALAGPTTLDSLAGLQCLLADPLLVA